MMLHIKVHLLIIYSESVFHDNIAFLNITNTNVIMIAPTAVDYV